MHGFDVRQALNRNCEIHDLWNAKACWLFLFFLDFDLKLFGLKKKRKQIPNKMVEKFFKLKKITAYENNLHYKEY